MLDNSGSWRWLIFTDSVPATVDCLEALEILPVVRLSSACEDTTEALNCRLEPVCDDRWILLPSNEYLGANTGKLILVGADISDDLLVSLQYKMISHIHSPQIQMRASNGC
jgi:hypothetical protein